MSSNNATRRYFLTKEWIDTCTFKFIFVSVILLAIVSAIEFLSLPPPKSEEIHRYTECRVPNSDPGLCVEFVNVTSPAIEHHQVTNQDENQAQTNKLKVSSYIKDKRSINAQEGSWRATNLIAILTIFQVLIGFIGLWFLFKTLRATAKALRYTKDTLKEARIATYTRGANVLPETVNVGTAPDSGTEIVVSILCKNFGETPARNIMINSGIRPNAGVTGMSTLPVDIDMENGPKGIFLGPNQMRQAEQTLYIPVVNGAGLMRSGSCFVAAVIRYDTIFDDDPDQAKEVEFYCRVDFEVSRQRDEKGRNPVVAKGRFVSLTPDIRRIGPSADMNIQN